MTVRLAVLALALVGAACSARLGAATQGGGGDDDPHADASRGGGSGSNNAAVDAAVDPSTCPTGRVVYLSFDGQTLTKATPSDATANQAEWMGVATGTLAKWRPTASPTDRATMIQTVVDGLTSKVATFAPSIRFVTTRPAAGPYVMIGFGGADTNVGVAFNEAVAHLDCGDANPSDVGWVFEDVTNTEHAITSAAGALGFGLGLTGTTGVDDCMCGWLTDCDSSNNPCTFQANAQDAELDCPNETDPQHDQAVLAAFCN